MFCFNLPKSDRILWSPNSIAFFFQWILVFIKHFAIYIFIFSVLKEPLLTSSLWGCIFQCLFFLVLNSNSTETTKNTFKKSIVWCVFLHFKNKKLSVSITRSYLLLETTVVQRPKYVNCIFAVGKNILLRLFFNL